MEKLPNNSDDETSQKYDIVFIGGGPATLAFLSYVSRNKSFENFFSKLNVLIIEKSKAFGSGCLGKYGINSNTSAEGFVRLICFNDDENGKEEKQNLSPNKNKINNNHTSNKNAPSTNNTNNKIENPHKNLNKNLNNKSSNNASSYIFNKFKSKVVPLFEELLYSNQGRNLLTIGSKTAPLCLIGNFMDCIGNLLASYIYKHFQKKILLLNSEVIKISFDYQNFFEPNHSQKNCNVNDIKTSNYYPYEIFVQKSLKNCSKSNSNSCGSSANTDIIKHLSIKAKIVVLASGAKQKFDPKIKQEIFKLINPNDFFHSDYVLQEPGFNHFANNLKLKDKKKVVIIGGSHSAFSCAWIILNNYIDLPKLKETNKEIRPNNANRGESGNFTTKYNINCGDCQYSNCCFGEVVDHNWVNSTNLKVNFDNLEILILYHDHIKVYYHSERDALNDGYNVYDSSKAVNKNGNVYPFIGIRGDAKELYRRIITGKEKRVKLIKTTSFNDQKNYIMKASSVIWACGYNTQKVPFFGLDKSKSEIEFFLDSGNQFEVDKELHILNKKKQTFINLFGIGQGYSTHSIEQLTNGQYARADSVNLYNTYISKKLFKALDVVFNISGEYSIEGNIKESENSKKTNLNFKTQENTSITVDGQKEKDNKSSNLLNKRQSNNKLTSGHANTNACNITNQNNLYNSNKSNLNNWMNNNNNNNNDKNETLNNLNIKQIKASEVQINLNSANFLAPNIISKSEKFNTSSVNIVVNNNDDPKKYSSKKNSLLSSSMNFNNRQNIDSNNNNEAEIVSNLNFIYNSNDVIKTKNSDPKNSSTSISRAHISKGYDRLASNSKNNFFKSPFNNDSDKSSNINTNALFPKYEINSLKTTNEKNHGCNYNFNYNNELSPSFNNNNPYKRHIPTKREPSRLKTLHPITANLISNNLADINQSNKANNQFSSPQILNSNKISNKTFSSILNSNNSKSKITPNSNLYHNKYVNALGINYDYELRSPGMSEVNMHGNINKIYPSNEAIKNYKDIKEKKSAIGSNNNLLKVGNMSEFNRNQIYFNNKSNGNYIYNDNEKNNYNKHFYSISQLNASEEKNNNTNDNNGNIRYAALNSPILDKTSGRYRISPIPSINRNKSKYMLYDSTKNINMNIVNANQGNINVNNKNNFSYNVSNFHSNYNLNNINTGSSKNIVQLEKYY